jgi:hypothetical protein
MRNRTRVVAAAVVAADSPRARLIPAPRTQARKRVAIPFRGQMQTGGHPDFFL